MNTFRHLITLVLSVTLSGAAFADDSEDARIRAEVRSQIDERLAVLLSHGAMAHDSEDARIAAEVRRRIDDRPSMKSYDITVRSLDHVVYLDGLVRTDRDRVQAGDVARQVSGVNEVRNDIGLNACGFCKF